MRRSAIAQISTQTIDGAILVGIVAGLTAVFVTAPSDSPFVFRYGEPSVLTMWTAAAHHDSVSHLASNATAYALVVGVTYAIYTAQERRTAFWLVVTACLLLTPLVTTAADYWLLAVQWDIVAPSTTAQGFSGVVSALVGVLLVTLIGPTTEWLSCDTAESDAPQRRLLAAGWLVAAVLTVSLLHGGVDVDGRFVNSVAHAIGLITGGLIATAVSSI